MQPQLLANFFKQIWVKVGLIWINLGKSWANLEKICVNLDKMSAAWPRGLKRRFYGDRVITIA